MFTYAPLPIYSEIPQTDIHLHAFHYNAAHIDITVDA